MFEVFARSWEITKLSFNTVLLFIILSSLDLVIILIAVLYFIIVMLVFSVANTVFNTALYVYADTGKIPEGYSQEILSIAFKRRDDR